MRMDLEEDDIDTSFSLRVVDVAGRLLAPLLTTGEVVKGEWVHYLVCLPHGHYSLEFRAGIGHRERVTMEIDNIELLSREGCESMDWSWP